MVFEGLDCSLSWVGPVVSWGGQLVLKVFSFNVCNQFFGDFIVKTEELGAEPTAFQIFMAVFNGADFMNHVLDERWKIEHASKSKIDL